MKTATVVIGANFGDEGKGLITDFETRRTGANLVSRFNGGAQAGHTVHDNGRSHVFGHVGAGSFAGAMTHLSAKFLVNPLLMMPEVEKLRAMGIDPVITVDPRARVSTIYDMILNSATELLRGSSRHGSCGMGINETVTRHAAGFELAAADLSRPAAMLAKKLQYIKDAWVLPRIQMLMKNDYFIPSDEQREQFSQFSSVLNMSSLHHATQLRNNGAMLNVGVPSVPTRQHVVLEGAQGLALDEFMGVFPHVTRSMTGLPYAIMAAADLGIKEIQPVYVTRAYGTRHGAGPLEGEGLEFGQDKIVDSTNIHNPWQGSIRYAPLNMHMLDKLIWADLVRGKIIAEAHDIKILTPTVALTCMDQVKDKVLVQFENESEWIPREAIPEEIKNIGLKVSHISRGPEAKDVTFFGYGV